MAFRETIYYPPPWVELFVIAVLSIIAGAAVYEVVRWLIR